MSEWISVKDRLPEDDLPENTKRRLIRVLVTVNHNGKKYSRAATRQRRKSQGEMQLWYWSNNVWDVTDWMPFPDPAP